MEIIVTTAFMAHGKRVEPGEVINLPEADAAYAIGLGRAAPIDEMPDAAPAKKPTPAKKAK